MLDSEMNEFREMLLRLRNRIENLEQSRVKIPEYRELEQSVHDQGKELSRLSASQSDLQNQLEALQSPEQNLPGADLPQEIWGNEDLKKFITGHPHMGSDWAAEQLPGGKGPGSLYDRCRYVRDEVAAKCRNIARLNDFNGAVWDSHGDALYIPVLREYVDFCRGSTDGGSLREKLQWLQAPVQPGFPYIKRI